MAEPNPFQSPAVQANAGAHDQVLIAKSFTYGDAPASKGAIFHGAVVAGADALVLSHDKHTWQSAGTAAAMFGLIGMAIHALMTRNKPIAYPYPVLPADETPDAIRDRFMGHKFKPNSVISVIPRDEVVSYTFGMFSKKVTLRDGTNIEFMSAVKKGMKRLPELGYELAQ